ncbi:MAG TPA: hypothetical protein VGJ95_24635, partial [Pseudonocardiaceae bacterium]
MRSAGVDSSHFSMIWFSSPAWSGARASPPCSCHCLNPAPLPRARLDVEELMAGGLDADPALVLGHRCAAVEAEPQLGRPPESGLVPGQGCLDDRRRGRLDLLARDDGPQSQSALN